MKVLIVAGGRGERLRPATDGIPKPMIKVHQTPVLEHILGFFKSYGYKEFVFALCYLPEVIRNYFGDGSKFDVKIEYTYEDPASPMGTAGAILPAKGLIDGTFIVSYADTLRKLDLTEMIKQHKEKRALATIHIYERVSAGAKSSIAIDGQNKITEFLERPDSKQLKSDKIWSNGSLYVLEPEIYDFIPAEQPSDFGKDVFPAALAAGKSLYAFPSNDYFIDIADAEKLRLAEETYKVD